MTNNWTSIKKNLRKKSSSAWSLKVKNPPHGKSAASADPTHQLAAALANISHGSLRHARQTDRQTYRRFYYCYRVLHDCLKS